MTKLKRLATKDDNIVIVHNPISDEEFKERHEKYSSTLPKVFAKQYINKAYEPVNITYKSKFS
jgi:hypothetical protein